MRESPYDIKVSGEKNSSSSGAEESSENVNEVDKPEDYLESTLLEIHELISDIENPFTLVGKLVSSLGKDKTIELLTGEKKDEPRKEPDGNRDSQSPPPLPAFFNSPKRPEPENPVASPKNNESSSSPKNLEQRDATHDAPKKEVSDKGDEGARKNVPDSPTAEKPWDRTTAPAEGLMPSPVEPPLSPRPTIGEPPATPLSMDAVHQDQEDSMLRFPSTILLQREALGGDAGLQAGSQSGFYDNLELAQKLNSLELANVMATLFGKDGSIEVLGCYAKRNWVEEEVARLILDAITLLGKVDSSKVSQGVKDASTQDHRIALYLIQQYSRSLMSAQESARFQDQLAIIKSILEVASKTSPSTAFREQGDLR